jgi:hypothetical protein
MGDRSGSFLGCAQVRTKVHRKEYDWSVGLVYDPSELSGVTTARPGVTGVLQWEVYKCIIKIYIYTNKIQRWLTFSHTHILIRLSSSSIYLV